MLKPLHVAITGAAGKVAYSTIFRIASGEVFGRKQPVVLRLMELESVLPVLEGICLELEDCAFPLLVDTVVTGDYEEAFENASWVLLIGAVPRKIGMERNELLVVNSQSFAEQGRAIEENAASDVRILVVGNPTNTNCYVARSHAPGIPDNRWFAMTKLDENRAKAQLAQKAGVSVGEVTNLGIWGNHSATQFPDAWHARIDGYPAAYFITDREWLGKEFVEIVQNRGAEIIATCGFSSAASAANAIVDTVKAIHKGVNYTDWLSVAVISEGQYGVPKGLVFSYPVIFSDNSWQVVEGIQHGGLAKKFIQKTTEELIWEKSRVSHMVKD